MGVAKDNMVRIKNDFINMSFITFVVMKRQKRRRLFTVNMQF